jgi:crotonobetainyl-CoA:carnitine CoA-transferase CaiB-like acyl-CoA transferase
VFASIGVVAALLARATSGRGQLVDVSLQAAVTGSLEHVPGYFHQDGRVPHRQGTLHWTRYFRVGRCRDGWVMHCTLGDWTSLFAWMQACGYGTGFEDEAWDGTLHRQRHAEALFDELDRWAANYTVTELYEGAQLRRLPYAAVRPPEALLDDPHLAARGFFVPIEHPELGAEIPYPGAPFVMADSPWQVARAPRLGEHTATVEHARRPTPRASTPAMECPDGPLAGVRVLDFTWVVAGPVTTRILADLGAEVIKIERKDALDFGDRRGGLSGTLMRGKQSVALDLTDPRGVAVARALALRSDVVVDNFSARVMTNLGLDWETLSTEKPDVVCVRMTGYGLTGPDRDKVSYGPTLQALTGYTMLMAEPGGPPAGFGYSYSDLASGHMGALAALAAVLQRRRTGRGQLVDLAQQEAVASLLGPVLLDRAVHGGASTATGNASQEAPAAPHGVYPCRGDDRWLAVTVFTDDEWRGLAAAMGRPVWADAPRFATTAGRVAHARELDDGVAAWTRTMNVHVGLSRLQAHGVPAGLVADAADACAGDPALAARGHFVDVATPEGRTVRIDGPPFVLSDTPARVRGPGPLLGEHADRVLRDVLGYDAETIARLRRDGVLV